MKFAICDSKNSRADQIYKLIDRAYFGTTIEYTVQKFMGLQDLVNCNMCFDVCVVSEENYDDKSVTELSRQNRSLLLIYIISGIDIVYDLMKTNPYAIICDKNMDFQLNETLIRLMEKSQCCSEKFVFRYKGTIYSIALSDILFFEYNDRHIKVYTCTNDAYHYIDTLCSLERQLNKDIFVRVHSAFIVNMNYIKSISRELIILINNAEIPVSRYKYSDIKEKYYNFLARNEFYI